jgi:hypothetical protein
MNEEHELAIDLPIVAARVQVHIKTPWQAVAQCVAANLLARMHSVGPSNFDYL